MKIDRRKFLKTTGVCLLGLGIANAKNVFAEGEPVIKTGDKALTGKRWALVVDTRKCREDCRDCVVACHKIHNVPKIDNKEDEIKWLWKETYEHAFPSQKHEHLSKEIKEKEVMVLCNHCDNPACVRVCPTNATFKREDGIVMMDYHRCIGCRYCMAACPYGARSFNFKDPRHFIKDPNPSFPTRTKGVVEKCNFCAERLAVGKLPACVEACKYGALTFGDLADPGSEVRKLLESHRTIQRKPELGTQPSVYYIV